MPVGIYKRTKKRGGWKLSQESKNNIRMAMSGERNYLWKGDNAGYRAKHDWVIKWKGKPNYCEKCGVSDKRKYHWANIDHKYRRILDDYISMCVSCHRKYDYDNNNYQPKGRKVSEELKDWNNPDKKDWDTSQ